MPNSDANITRTELILDSMARLGVTSPSNEEKAQAVRILNAKIKEIDEQGRWLWAISNTETTLDIVAGTSIYTVGTPPSGIASGILELEQFQFLIGTNYQPVDIISKTESISTYERESSSSGDPIFVHLEEAADLADQRLILYPTPNAARTGKYIYRRRLYDFDNASDNPDFPLGWNIKLQKILAGELAIYYLPEDRAQVHIAIGESEMAKARAANESKQGTVAQVAHYF